MHRPGIPPFYRGRINPRPFNCSRDRPLTLIRVDSGEIEAAPEHPVIIEESAPTWPPAWRTRVLRMIAACVGRHPGRPHRKLTAEPAVLRLIAPLAFLVFAAIVACTGLAYVLARQADDYLGAGHRRALAGAVEAIRAVSP